MKNLLTLMVALALTGCVSKGTHENLKKAFDLSQKDLTACQGECARLNKELGVSQKDAADLRQWSEQLQGELDGAKSALSQSEELRAAALRDQKGLKASLEEMQVALAEAQKRKAEADARIKEYTNLVARFQPLIDAGKLQVKIVDGRMVLVMASDILFPSGQAALNKDGEVAIADVARVLASIPTRKYQIEGHTDNVPINTAQYRSNWELASARAITVLKKMIDAGLPDDRVSAASWSSVMPARANDTPEGRAANRRIEIVVLPDLSTLPGFEELNRVSAK